MLSRRQFLAGSASLLLAAACGEPVTLARRLWRGAPGSPPLAWQISGAAAMDTALAALYTATEYSVTVGGSVVEQGYRPASDGTYNALWTRDNAAVLWHKPGLQSATLRRQFVTQTLAWRSTSPPNFIADHVDASGTVSYVGGGATSALPYMDGIHHVILALWADWQATGDTSTFASQQSIIDDCLAVIPRNANGCVYSDPTAPSVDFGGTDTILKTGDVAYGTALQAWAYKMLDQMSGGGNSTNPAGTSYASLRATAQSGLATLYNSTTKWLRGSSGNNSGVDDVWASALAVAENLLDSATRHDIASNLASIYAAGHLSYGAWVSDISQFGLVRHLPAGQYWAGTSTTPDTYQNGGYWIWPLWDCVRAVDLVNPTLARTWASDFIAQVQAEYSAEADWTKVPYEWHNYGVGVGAKGYTASAAVVRRFV